jgi:enterochelin esterase-like enzyme
MNLTQLTLEIHVLIFAGISIFTVLVGFLFGRKQVKAKERRILELEDEMLAAHKEILHFAKSNKQLAETLEKAKIPYPVTRIDEEEDEKVRKIPLGKIG